MERIERQFAKHARDGATILQLREQLVTVKPAASNRNERTKGTVMAIKWELQAVHHYALLEETVSRILAVS